MSAIQTIVSYFSFKKFSGSVSKRADEAIVYYSLRCLQTDPDFSDFSFGSYLFFLAASLTAQGLSLQEMQPWTTTCSQVFFDVISNLLFFNFGGAFLLVELSFWWSSSSHSFGLAQWWRFRFSYYCCCAHLSAVVERCVWHCLVHTARQRSKQGPDLLATGPGFDPC